MTEELKYQIVAGAKEYASLKQISNNDVAKLSGVNAGYISNMFREQFTNMVDGKEVPIGDRWFYKLAEWAGLPVRKQYWQVVQTHQFMEVVTALATAKKSSRISVIICDTGLGKTYSVDRFVHNNPQHTYKVTVSDAHKLRDILNELLDMLHIEQGWSTASKLKLISNKLKELKRNGHSPLIILDEAENMKLPVIKALKALYDSVNGFASVTLIGTQQLLNDLERMRKKDRNGVPQFYRRIKASIRSVNTSYDFTPFYELFQVEKPLRKLLNDLCDNYGELHDYLEPALREADELDQPLTENLFRMMYNMPKYG